MAVLTDPRNYHRAFKRRARRGGVPVIPVHATRRTYAGLLVELEVHPRVAMLVLRHSKIALTTEVYGPASTAGTRSALFLLGGQLGDAPRRAGPHLRG